MTGPRSPDLTDLWLALAAGRMLLRRPDDAGLIRIASAHLATDTPQQLADSIANGTPLTPAQINLLGQFDTVLSALLDLGYERADQLYRNSAKAFAAVTAMVLALVGGGLLSSEGTLAYLCSKQALLALLVGALSVPLAVALVSEPELPVGSPVGFVLVVFASVSPFPSAQPKASALQNRLEIRSREFFMVSPSRAGFGGLV